MKIPATNKHLVVDVNFTQQSQKSWFEATALMFKRYRDSTIPCFSNLLPKNFMSLIARKHTIDYIMFDDCECKGEAKFEENKGLLEVPDYKRKLINDKMA